MCKHRFVVAVSDKVPKITRKINTNKSSAKINEKSEKKFGKNMVS